MHVQKKLHSNDFVISSLILLSFFNEREKIDGFLIILIFNIQMNTGNHSTLKRKINIIVFYELSMLISLYLDINYNKNL